MPRSSKFLPGPALQAAVPAALALALAVAAVAGARAGTAGGDEPSGDTPPTPLLSPARIRVPSPAWVRGGDTMTGSIEASIETPAGNRPAHPEEIRGVVKLGVWSADQGIVNEITQPVEGGRFVLGGLAEGDRILRFFLGDGVGAEVARVHLMVSARAGAAPPERFAAPLLAPEAGEILLTGPFSGGADDARLTVDGKAARLVWETGSAALFQVPDVHPGRSGLSLARAGQPPLRADLFVVGVRFSGPDPPQLDAQGDDALLEARVEGLPPLPGEPEAPPWPERDRDRALVTVAWRNDSRDTVTGIRTKQKGGWEHEGELLVPVRFDSVTSGGIAVIRAKAHARSRGPVRVGARFILDEELTRPLVPLAPGS